MYCLLTMSVPYCWQVNNNSSLEVCWSDNHKSHFSLPWLLSRQFTSKNRAQWLNTQYRPQQQPWPAEQFLSTLQRYTYKDIIDKLVWFECKHGWSIVPQYKYVYSYNICIESDMRIGQFTVPNIARAISWLITAAHMVDGALTSNW